MLACDEGIRVDIPMFSGEASTNWITRAEVYCSGIKVDLAQLCKDGSTIPFFMALIDSKFRRMTKETMVHKDLLLLLSRFGGIF